MNIEQFWSLLARYKFIMTFTFWFVDDSTSIVAFVLPAGISVHC